MQKIAREKTSYLENEKISKGGKKGTSMPETDTPKGVENLKLQIEIFTLKINKQPNKRKNKTQTKKIRKTARQQIMDCSANAHAQIPSILGQWAPARTVW